MAKVLCPISTCDVMIEKNEHDVRNHFRWKHPKLKNKAYWRDKACKFVDSSGFKTRKAYWRDKACKFVDSSGFKTRSRASLENDLCRQLDIK